MPDFTRRIGGRFLDWGGSGRFNIAHPAAAGGAVPAGFPWDGRPDRSVIRQTTAALRAALAAAGSNTVEIPGGNWWIDEPLDATGRPGGVKLVGERGAVARLVWAGEPGAAIIEGTGSHMLDIADLWLDATSSPAACGILLARTTGAGTSGAHSVRRVTVSGSFSVANLVEVGSESNVIQQPWLENSHGGAGSRCYLRCNHTPQGISPAHAPVVGGMSSNVHGMLLGGAYIHYGPGIPIEISAAGDILVSSVTTFAESAAGVRLSDGCTAIRIDTSRLEGHGDGNVIEMVGPHSYDTITIDTVGVGYGGRGRVTNAIHADDGSVVRNLLARMNAGYARNVVNVDDLRDSQVWLGRAPADLDRYAVVRSRSLRNDWHDVPDAGATGFGYLLIPALGEDRHGNTIRHEVRGLVSDSLGKLTITLSGQVASNLVIPTELVRSTVAQVMLAPRNPAASRTLRTKGVVVHGVAPGRFSIRTDDGTDFQGSEEFGFVIVN